MRYLILTLTLTISLGGVAWAASGVIDGSSKEAYERSLKAIGATLNDDEKEAFSKGILNMIISRYPPAAGAEGLAMLQFMPAAIEAAHLYMDGVTADEIMKLGQEIVAKHAAQKTAKTRDAEPKEGILACLKEKVILAEASFEKSDFSYYTEFKVTNHLPYAIAGLWLSYRIKSDNRSVPWDEQDSPMSIAGGIEPGETRTLEHSFSLLPSSTPADAKVTISLMDVADENKRLVIQNRGVMDWPNEKSPHGC